MGSSLSRLFGLTFHQKEAKILVLGLDGAGKTTILYKIKLGVVLKAEPTIGHINIEEVEYKMIQFTMMDFGGNDTTRISWREYFKGA